MDKKKFRLCFGILLTGLMIILAGCSSDTPKKNPNNGPDNGSDNSDPEKSSWISRGMGGGGAFYSPSFSPFNPDEFYVATDMSAVFHTLNAGKSWKTVSFTKLLGGVDTHVRFTSDRNVLYSIDLSDDKRTPVKSVDSGKNWAAVTDPASGSAQQLFADRQSTQRVILYNGESIYFSNDGGTSFNSVYTTSNLHVGGVVWNGNLVIVGTSDGILVSENNGDDFTLQSVSGIPTSEKIVSLAGATSGNTTKLCVVTMGSGDVFTGVRGSSCTDYRNIYTLSWGQTTWAEASEGIQADHHPFFVRMTEGDIDTIYVAGGTTDSEYSPVVYKSSNGGDSFQQAFIAGNNENIQTGWIGYRGDKQWSYPEFALGFAVSPVNKDYLMISDLGSVHLSTDGGDNWVQVYAHEADTNPKGSETPKGKAYTGIGLEDTSAWWLHWADEDDLIVCATDINGMVSNDGGKTFKSGSTLGMPHNTTYHAVENSSGTIFAATSTVHDLYQSTYLADSRIDGGDGHIIVSDDDGASWSLFHDFNHPVIYLAFDPTDNETLYAAVVHSSEGGLYVNRSLSTTPHAWTRLAVPDRTEGHPTSIDILDDGAILATYSGRRNSGGAFTESSGAFYSVDGGTTWEDRSDSGMTRWTKSCVIDPHDATQNTWYASVFSHWGHYPNEVGGIYKTTNRGESWTRISDSYRVESVTIHPDNADVMYFATETKGLWKTENLSSSSPEFSLVEEYLFSHPVRVLFNPNNHKEIWTVSFGGGLRVYTDTSSGDSSDDTPDTPDNGSGERFSFVVFGDLNGGGCGKNDRIKRLVTLMDATDAHFFVQTGDLVEGYGAASCFASEPSDTECTLPDESGNVRQTLLPLLNRTLPQGLRATFFPVVGNHDTNSDWYPDPCGNGLCDFLDMNDSQVKSVYLNRDTVLSSDGIYPHTVLNGAICDKESRDSYPQDFYYAFSYKNSHFIILNQNQDYSGMFSCNGGYPGFDSCADYCSEESLFLDSARNRNCYNIERYDWLVAELRKASSQGAEHIFVFSHAPLVTSSENHGPTQGSRQLRDLFDSFNVTAYFNGHNHAYERTVPVRAGVQDNSGTVYITVGSAGASTDTIQPDDLTASSYQEWSRYGELEKMTTYLKITVNGSTVSGNVTSLGVTDRPVDSFSL